MIQERQETQYQAVCEWCGIPVSAWYSQRAVIKSCLESHIELHREQGREGQSIRAVDWPR
jgi:hypothetical protein